MMEITYLLAKPQQELVWFDSLDKLKEVVSVGDEVTCLYPDGQAVKSEWANMPTGKELTEHMAENTLWLELPKQSEILATLSSLKGDEQAKAEYIRLLAESYQDTAETLADCRGGCDGH